MNMYVYTQHGMAISTRLHLTKKPNYIVFMELPFFIMKMFSGQSPILRTQFPEDGGGSEKVSPSSEIFWKIKIETIQHNANLKPKIIFFKNNNMDDITKYIYNFIISFITHKIKKTKKYINIWKEINNWNCV